MLPVGDYENPGIGDPSPTNPGGDNGGGGGDQGGPPVSNPIGTSVFNLVFHKHEAASILRVLVYAGLVSGDDLQLVGYLIVDGVVRQASVINLILDNQRSNASMPLTIPAFITGLPVGQHSVAFSILNREPDSALTVRAGATIEVTELKNAAI